MTRSEAGTHSRTRQRTFLNIHFGLDALELRRRKKALAGVWQHAQDHRVGRRMLSNQAADWALKALARPNSHVVIQQMSPGGYNFM